MAKISLVIPCYNEACNLAKLLELCAKSLVDKDVEIILVNNGSSDNSDEVLKELLPKYSFARVCKVKVNKGYGYGILQGLKEARSEYIGWTHADLQTDPGDILKALPIIEQAKKPVFIKGRRYGRSLFDVSFTFFMSVINSVMLRTIMRDINAQPTIFPRKFFEKWVNPPHDFSLDLYSYYLAKKRGLKIKRIKVYFGKRIAGEAHLKDLPAKIRYSIKSLRYSFSILFNREFKGKGC